MPTNTDRKRILGVAFFTFLLFSLLIAQFYKIQILQGEKWADVAKRQHFFVVDEPFKRGAFYANTYTKKNHPEINKPFVIDIEVYHLFIDPVAIPEARRSEISQQLFELLEMKESEWEHLREQFEKKSRSRKVAMWLSPEKREKIMKWWQPISRKYHIPRNALFFVNDYQRSYPFGKLLGQVLHTVQKQKDETTKQAIPTGGLELKFNSLLKGKLGKRLMMRSPRHAFDTGTMEEEPENGADIYLTINPVLQAIAEEEIEKGVVRCNANAGWAVMMDPKTGEVLALAQYPFFDPNHYETYFSEPEKIEQTKVRAVTDAREPGSAAKAITLATALIANRVLLDHNQPQLFEPEGMIDTTQSKFPGRPGDLKDLRLHKFMNMDMALQKSGNVYMAVLVQRIIERLGPEWYRSVLQNVFGFGIPTGIELPAEYRGLLPTPGKKHGNGKPEWSGATPYSLAMGHNLQANTMQMLRAFSLFVNGGYLVEPTLIRKIVRKDEVLVDNTREQRLRKFPHVLDPTIANRVVRSLLYVTQRGGTGRRASVWGYTEAGKSSTEEKVVNGRYSKTQHVASFVGFTPVVNPPFVLMIVLDEPECKYIPGVGKNHHGGTAAAPVFREIARRSLEYLGIPPDDPHGYPANDPRYDPDLAYWEPEARQLQEMYEKWNK